MREITPDSFTVYSLDELHPEAREAAIDGVRELLAGEWWDNNEIADITEVMTYTIANKFGTPGHGDFGVGDFPGIPDVKLNGWDLDRADYINLDGYVDRDNAPSLPWTDGIIGVKLDCTSIEVEFDDTLTDDDIQLADDAMTSAIRDAMHEALRDGRAEMEYKTGPERAAEVAADREFYDDGRMYP